MPLRVSGGIFKLAKQNLTFRRITSKDFWLIEIVQRRYRLEV
jgi:hypothetical protein